MRLWNVPSPPGWRSRMGPASPLWFALTQGGLSRGVPTGYAASPLNEQIRPGSNPPPVWPWKRGTVRGIAFHPLYPSVPEAAAAPVNRPWP